MADLYDFVVPTGIIVPDTSSLLGEVSSSYQAALGQDLITTPDTPQGVLITSETIAESGVVNNNAVVANQINPNISTGVFLDAIGMMSGIQRAAQTQTVVPAVTLTGVIGTIIPAGSQAKTAAGDVFATLTTVAIGTDNTATVDFASVEFGPIICAAHALSIPVTSILGWETVDNTTAGILGASTQSDQSYRAYRNNTLGFQGVALAVAQTSALYATPGVKSLSFLENYEAVPAGALIEITGGATLAGQIWGMTTTGFITVGSTSINFAESLQTLPTLNPWPVAHYGTVGNILLTGLTVQGGGDWTSLLTAGDIILATSQTNPVENGLWVAGAGAWTRQAYNAAASIIQGSLGGISLKKNSIYACVSGGSDLDVSAALLENKSSGCGWNGATTVDIVEPVSGQTYIAQFDRPTPVPILIRVTSAGSVSDIKQAILDYAAGAINGLSGFIVGADVSPFEIPGAIITEFPNIFVNKVEISLASPIVYTTDLIAIGLNQIATTQESYITVVSP